MIPECSFCGSIDVLELPSGAILCHICRIVTVTQGEIDRQFLREDWFAELDDRQRAEFLAPGNPIKCVSCHLLHGHDSLCRELNSNWWRMPWGKHQGVHVSDISTDYLLFVAKQRYGDSETQRMILAELERRNSVVDAPIVDG